MGSSAVSPAKEPQQKKPSFVASALLLALGVLGTALVIVIVDSLSSPSESARSEPAAGILEDRSANAHGDQLAALVAKYGRPDIDDSTEYDNPRPPMVTRWIEYKRRHVKIVFFPDCKVGDPPPYSAWRVVGYINTRLDAAISSQEAAELLQR